MSEGLNIVVFIIFFGHFVHYNLDIDSRREQADYKNRELKMIALIQSMMDGGKGS